MKQIYPEKPYELNKEPKKETVQFLISFSKSLLFVKYKSNFNIELNLN